MLADRVMDQAQSQGLIRRGDRILAAVSGGADSLALLHILWSIQRDLGFEMAVASLDHGWRGAAGAADVAYVEEVARRLGLVFHGGRVNSSADPAPSAAPDPAPAHGRSPEEAARVARYAFLGRVARAWGEGPAGPVRLATGHTSDDQAETVLMRIIEGTGLDGLAGMPPSRAEEAWILIRPLLGVTRAETRAYCRRRDLEPRDDPTNEDPRFRRGLVRTRILPALREYNPRVDEALIRLAHLARIAREEIGERGDDSRLGNLVRRGHLRDRPRPGRLGEPPSLPEGVGLPEDAGLPEGELPFAGLEVETGRIVFVARSDFAALGEGERTRLIRLAVGDLAGDTVLRDLGYEGARRAARAGDLSVGGRVDLPGRVVMEAGYRHVFFARAAGPATRAPSGPSPPVLAGLSLPGRTAVTELGWVFGVEKVDVAAGRSPSCPGDPGDPGRPGDPGHPRDRSVVDLDLAKVELPLAVRTRRDGDVFHPAGLGDPGVGLGKKLKEFFISVKLPRGERDRWPLVVDPLDRIVWVAGLRADERFVASAETRVALRLSAERLAGAEKAPARPPMTL
jgi:tRNA(Ile)-lysidine synthase